MKSETVVSVEKLVGYERKIATSGDEFEQHRTPIERRCDKSDDIIDEHHDKRQQFNSLISEFRMWTSDSRGVPHDEQNGGRLGNSNSTVNNTLQI